MVAGSCKALCIAAAPQHFLHEKEVISNFEIALHCYEYYF